MARPRGGRMQRRRVRVTGVVQGVGFRPFVYAAARRLGLTGFVRNEGDGVRDEVEGEAAALDQFVGELSTCPPAGARIAATQVEAIAATDSRAFVIEPSRAEVGRPAFLPADA